MNRNLLLVVLAGGSLVVLGVLGIVLIAGSPPPPPDPSSAPPPAAAPPREEAPEEEWVVPGQPQAPRRAAVDPRLSAEPLEEPEQPLPPMAPRMAEQAERDRALLGDEAYLRMQALWLAGRKGRGHPEAMLAMEELLEKFPDTFRAGCAAYELGQHHLKNGRVPPTDRLAKAEVFLARSRDRYTASRCDADFSAANMASFALALDVYRHTDRRRALSILEELAALPPTETDRLGRPLAGKARQMKDNLPPTPPSLDEPPVPREP